MVVSCNVLANNQLYYYFLNGGNPFIITFPFSVQWLEITNPKLDTFQFPRIVFTHKKSAHSRQVYKDSSIPSDCNKNIITNSCIMQVRLLFYQ